MTITTVVKRIQNIMRQDAGVDGDAQRISQLVWMLFLKVYDAREELWEFEEDDFTSIIPEGCRWRDWAIDNKDGQALTGDDLLNFINNTLFPALKELAVSAETPKRQAIVKYVFEDANNYMKNGTLLRQVINILNEIDFTEHDDSHTFNDIYESILKDLQSAGDSGEFYTPRPVTDFMVEMLNPQIHEKIADFACGTGGFLTSILKFMEDNITTQKDKEMVQRNLFGIEKKPLPYLLAITNLILHNIDAPNIIHDNSLTKNVRDYKENEKFNVIVMNPPYGGTEENAIRINFPTALQSSETADLFVALILYRLKEGGRVGIVMPDNFLSGGETSQKNLKEKLLNECDLHTIIRLPEGVFSPYTNIKTNLLFFSKTGPTNKIDYYEVQLPEGYRTFSKTKPFKNEHLQEAREWWLNRTPEDKNSYTVTIEEIKDAKYNLDFKNPNKDENEYEESLSQIILDLNKKSQMLSELVSAVTSSFKDVLVAESVEVDKELQSKINDISLESEKLKKDNELLMNNMSKLISSNSSLANEVLKVKNKSLSLAFQGKLVQEEQPIESAIELLELIAELKGKSLANVLNKEELFDIPENWEWAVMEDIIEMSKNLNIQAKLPADTLINYLDIDAIDNKNQRIGETKLEMVKNLSSRARRVLEKDMIVYSLVRPYLNNLAIVEEEKENYIGSTGLVAFKTVMVNNKYVFYYLLSPYVRKKFLDFISGFNSPSISIQQFLSLEIPIPPKAVQDRIVAKLDEITESCNGMMFMMQEK